MLVLAMLLAFQTAPAATPQNPFTSLEPYNGTWTVKAQHSFSGGTGSDTLVNHCHRGDAFYTCEQALNGKTAALIVFIPAKEPNHFLISNVLPSGRSTFGTTLTIDGNRWTYLTTDDAGHATFRVENTFTDRNHIHFELFSSSDEGKTWTKVNEGDDTRLKP